jgi:hypothetical protein
MYDFREEPVPIRNRPIFEMFRTDADEPQPLHGIHDIPAFVDALVQAHLLDGDQEDIEDVSDEEEDEDEDEDDNNNEEHNEEEGDEDESDYHSSEGEVYDSEDGDWSEGDVVDEEQEEEDPLLD